METTRRQCSICGRIISERFFVCMSCLRKYNISLKYREYPQWLKEIIKIDARDLRVRRRDMDHYSTEIIDG